MLNHPRSPRISLSKKNKLLFYILLLLVSITGIWHYYAYTLQMNDPDQIATYLIKTHGTVAALLLVMFGYLLGGHIPTAWHRHKNRMFGMMSLVIFSIMIASGYGLYYMPYEQHDLTKQIHVYSSLLGIVIIPLHIVIGKLRRANSHQHK